MHACFTHPERERKRNEEIFELLHFHFENTLKCEILKPIEPKPILQISVLS